VALASDYNGLAFQGGIEEFFDGDEEGVHVDVEDGAREGRQGGGDSHLEGIVAAGERVAGLVVKAALELMVMGST